MNGVNEGIIYWEQKIIEIDNNRLLSVAWAVDEKTGKDKVNHYTISQADDIKFCKPKPTDLNGQTPAILHLFEDVVLCVYRRTDKLGLWGAIVKVDLDGGWQTINQSCLWAPALPAGGPSAGLVEQFQGLKFGAPCLLKLSESEVFVAFWCLEDCVSNIRWIKLRLNR